MANVSLNDISKSFDGKENVVNEINAEIKDGDFVVIVGSSGCGKTTILNMIAGLEEPSSGSIHINGTNVTNIEPKDRNIAMVFQSHTLYPHLNIYKNLAFALKVRRVKKNEIDEKITSVSKMLGIEDLLKRKPHQLSGGQKQRVAIGRAIIREPLVFLMDEPLSNLDANLKDSMRGELKRLHRDLKATFIYVTHDQLEAMTLATKLIIMNMGEIQQIGSPYEIFMNPRNIFVAKFMGIHKINLIHCEIQKNEKGECIIAFCGICFCVQLDVSSDINKIWVGIRPESFEVSTDETGIRLHIISTEILGSDTLFKSEVRENSKKISINALLPTELVKENSSVIWVKPLTKMVLFFDSDTSRKIALNGEISFNFCSPTL